ncbi:hypothetical protein KSZ_39180 [Dictyobacter formicarum]|uniref:Uncharacterized protein n=1 Tax=Dictyobacter formicarum TaxID=2778368 RepID=A0ABQ3VJ32_9CHLR|nr:hypothetical protein KSZ_39180 [Dictyobacter formicarum]
MEAQLGDHAPGMLAMPPACSPSIQAEGWPPSALPLCLGLGEWCFGGGEGGGRHFDE